MDYPFKEIEHRIYKNTFLQNTFVEIQYESIKDRLSIKDVFSDLQHFALESFNINIEKEEAITENGVVISSQEMAIDFYITNKRLIIKIGRKNYKTFKESVIPYIKIAKTFIESVSKLDKIQSCEIRKINIWPYSNIASKRTLTETLMGKIFSKELLENGNFKSQIPENQNVTQWMNEKVFKGEYSSLKLKYGFIAKDENHDKERIILDSSIEMLQPTDLSDIEDVFNQLNTILFNAYHWSITEQIIQIMSREVE